MRGFFFEFSKTTKALECAGSVSGTEVYPPASETAAGTYLSPVSGFHTLASMPATSNDATILRVWGVAFSTQYHTVPSLCSRFAQSICEPHAFAELSIFPPESRQMKEGLIPIASAASLVE